MKKALVSCVIIVMSLQLAAQSPTYRQSVADGITVVKILKKTSKAAVNPMIYGQMLEDCNDNVVYGGVVNNAGEENPKVIELLRPLNIPVMRWPAGTAIYDYDWRRGIGPKEKRTPIHEKVWGGDGYGSESTVAVHIRHLREKIEINPAEPRYLKVVWAHGYKFEKGDRH